LWDPSTQKEILTLPTYSKVFSWELHQIFFKVNKTKKEIGFIIMELNYNDPKGKKVVQI
jgi:hypothetical protein